MSDSDESGVTYTEVEAALQAPPSLDYVPDPKEPEQAPPLPDYVPGPEHTDDEISNPEADPEEDDDEDPEEDPVDYLVDGGDDGDDEEGSSEDDEDDDMDIEADDEEEHLAPADSVVVALPATDQAPSAEEIEPFETDESATTPPPHPAYRMTAGISIPAPVPTPVWSNAWSSPLPQIPSPSLPLSPPSPVLSPAPPSSPIHAPSLGIPPPLPISVHTSSPQLLLPSASRREDRPEVTLPPRKRLGIALGSGYEVGESSSTVVARPAGGLRANYGFVATMNREIRRDPEREDTDEVYTRLDDEQSQRQLLAGRLNMLFRDKRAHAYTQVMSLRTTVLAQQSEIKELQSVDRRRQTVISELLAADYRRQRQLTEALKLVKSLQTQMTELQRQQGPAKGPAQP
ncbi:hypothetical protein Tco_1036745 [Tanacetum coccineum]